MNKTYLTFAFLLSVTLNLFGQQKPDPNFHLYILIGQSNMAGRGIISDEFKNEGKANVLMLNKTNEWIPAKHPLHFDKPNIAGVGPGLAFGISMSADVKKRVRIGLVPAAVGGTPIEEWVPGAYDKATDTHPYDDALIRIKEAMKSGVIKGVIWHQGEGNSSAEKAPLYLAQLKSLIERIRAEVGNPTLPVVVGELGQYRDNYKYINDVLAKVSDSIPYTALATSEGLIHKGDGTHFDAISAQKFGLRFAEQMKKLQSEK
jgi:hypothetical protein